MLNSFFYNPNIFFVKYGELVLKKGNRDLFIQLQVNAIKRAFFDFECEIKKSFDYLILTFQVEADHEFIIQVLKNIPGINAFYTVQTFSLETPISELVQGLQNQIEKAKTFRVSVKRKNKNYAMTSMEFAKQVSAYILKQNPHLQVNLKNYDLNVQIEIHQHHFYVLSEKHEGFGGLPIAKSNKTLVLISGGIDSPVAAKLMFKKGFHCDFITFISPPYTSLEAKKKTIALFQKVTMNGRICNSRLFIISYTNIQNEITHISNQAYRINLMRRSFFRIAQQLGHYLHTYTITTGESLGQVASQTIESMRTISLAIDPYFLVFRPLLTFDKEEIIKKAKTYGTYNLSIQPYPDSCSIFAPKNPITVPEVKTSMALEKEIELLVTLEQDATKKENMEVVYANQISD